MVCLTLIAPLSAIVVVEAMYRVSKNVGGFSVNPGSEDTVTFVSRS